MYHADTQILNCIVIIEDKISSLTLVKINYEYFNNYTSYSYAIRNS